MLLAFQNIRFLGGLEFIGKGESGGHLYYFEAPLYASYWATLPGSANVFGGLGPYFGYGIGQNFGDNGGFKPFDAGLTLTAGYQVFNSLSFRLGYDFGLVNTSRDQGIPNMTQTSKNRSIGLSIGYALNKLTKK